MPDGRRIYVLADGRLVNLGAAEGHPAMVMDMSFADQALGLEWLRAHVGELEPRVYGIPDEIDREVARLKLISHGRRDRRAGRRSSAPTPSPGSPEPDRPIGHPPIGSSRLVDDHGFGSHPQRRHAGTGSQR